MRTALGVAVAVFACFWVVKDPTGAANTVAYVGHALGVAASTLAQHLSTRKPALTGVSPQMDQETGPA